MGETLGKLFVDPSTLPGGSNCGGNHTLYHDLIPDDPLNCAESGFGFVQVLFLMIVYGCFLFYASNLISDGSELLLLIPSLRDVVGSVVLPILGAVPDGAIVLFSGLGDDAQNQVAVGVGALAGSTIMLLTLPWFLAVLGGRVDLDTAGRPIYKKPRGAPASWKKLSRTGTAAWTGTGVSLRSDIRTTAKIMLMTSLIYMLIQGPAFSTDVSKHQRTDEQASVEKDWALAGFLACFFSFCCYLLYQVRYADVEEAVDRATKQAIGQRLISLSAAFALEVKHQRRTSASEVTPLMDREIEDKRFRAFVESYFHKYDVNGDGQIDSKELLLLFRDLNEGLTREQLDELMVEMDTDRSGTIDFEEFSVAMMNLISKSADGKEDELGLSVQQSAKGADDSMVQPHVSQSEDDDDDDDDDEEEEDIPEEFQHLSADAQQSAILRRSLWMMSIGTAIVLLFSDPMVDVLDSIGERVNVGSFYVAFVLAPLASNASELVAAFSYAKKKTKKTMAISLATLEGAAIMNNTFCLCIFLLLVYLKKLAWQFSAETISILLIQIIMFGMAHKRVHTIQDACIILSLYPISLVVVNLLETQANID